MQDCMLYRRGTYIRCTGLKLLYHRLAGKYAIHWWLYETEYLIGSVGLSASGKYATVTLSPKALEILKVIPESIDEITSGKSIGDELSDALGSAAKEKVIDLAKKALSYLFTIGWGSLNITG